jgi:hypothetical protein
MSAPTRICLKFSGEIPRIVRSRILHAFRVFAAIYNYRVVEPDSEGGAICFEYAKKPSQQSGAPYFHIPARYDRKARAALSPYNSTH